MIVFSLHERVKRWFAQKKIAEQLDFPNHREPVPGGVSSDVYEGSLYKELVEPMGPERANLAMSGA